MKQDYLYTIGTAAYIFWAAVGGLEQYQKDKYNELLFLREKNEARALVSIGCHADPVAADIIYAEAMMKSQFIEAERLTLEAVGEALEAIRRCTTGREIIASIEHVYFRDPPKFITENSLKPDGATIHARVIAAAASIHAGERSIYYWLACARTVWAWKRGLVLCDCHKKQLKELNLIFNY